MFLLVLYFYLGTLVRSELLDKTIKVSVTSSSGITISTAIPVQEGISLQSGLFLEVQPYGLLQCIRKCLLHQDCVGLLHHGTSCGLGKHLSGFQIAYSPSNAVFVGKTTISNELKQILAAECDNASCGERHVCQSLTTGHQCFTTECAAFPFNVTNTFANLTVGAVNDLSCPDGLTQYGNSTQICQTDGQWAPGDLQCVQQPICNTSLGYASYPVACFRAVRKRTAKLVAQSGCEADGATLARIDSQAKYDAMVTEVGTGGLYFLDGIDPTLEGIWQFQDGTPMTYFNWYVSSYTPGHCIAYYPPNGITKMSCTQRHYYLCEIR